jgi:hypothetical protein
MIKSMLLAASIAVSTICAPVLAEEVSSPKSVPVTATLASVAAVGAFSNGGNTPPAMSLYAVNIANNIACRSKARSKYFELSARDMSNETLNAQWATIGSMQAVVWCRDSQAIIAVAGSNYDSVKEVRDEIVKAF